MKKIGLILLFGMTVSSLGARDWPRQPLGGGEKLFFDEARFAEMRQRIDDYQWAADLFVKLQEGIENPVPRVWNHAAWGESLRIRDAALYYRISGDEKYMPQVVEGIVKSFSLDNAGQHRLFDNTKSNPNLWTWLMFRGGYFQAYDLIKTHPLMAPYTAAMDQRLDEIIEGTRSMLRDMRKITNTWFWAVTLGLGAAGFMRGDMEAVNDAIYDERYGMKAFLDTFRDGGRFVPEPFGYGYDYVACCMTILAEAARFNGVADLYNYETESGASMKKMVRSYLSITNPGGTTLANGDGGEQYTVFDGQYYHETLRLFNNQTINRTRQKLDIFHYAYRDPHLAWILSNNPKRDDWDYSFWGYAALTHGLPLDDARVPDARSAVWHEMGDAHIKAVEGPEYWDGSITVHVRDGATLATHNHNDHFHFTMNAYGKNIYTDWFYQFDYLAPRASNNYANTTPFTPGIFSHNTVAVDGAQPKANNIVYSGIERKGGAQVFSATGAPYAYAGVEQKRTFVVTKEYVADIFEMRSDTPHTYDYIIHSLGEAAYEGVGPRQPYPQINDDYRLAVIDNRSKSPDNVWIHEAWKAAAEDGFGVRFRDSDGIGSFTTLIGEKGTEVISGGVPLYIVTDGWDKSGPIPGKGNRKPMMIVRRTASSTTYFALHQPYRGESEKLAFSRNGNVLTVEGSGFTDTYDTVSGEYKRKNAR